MGYPDISSASNHAVISTWTGEVTMCTILNQTALNIQQKTIAAFLVLTSKCLLQKYKIIKCAYRLS